VDDGRGELRAIARETRTLLERERARGRSRIVLGTVGTAAVSGVEGGEDEGLAGVLFGFSPAKPSSSPPPTPGTVEVLAMPGFEAPAATPAPAIATVRAPLAPSTDLPQDLAALSTLVSTCRKCGLCETRTQTVFADGSPTAKLMFVGEAPGRDEDAQGLPFVGRAGQLLNKMIAAIDLKREEVYICNVLKCRPPENRTPLPEEVEQCLPYLEQQIAVVKPALICALGLSAVQALLGTKASMTSMRGRTYVFRGVPLVPTYHPAALLRNPSLKREAWVDLQRVRDLLLAGGAS
jgi:uracil-DNA glycosylase